MEVVFGTFLFILGACVGSFLNVVVWRLPRGESLCFPASHCPGCGKAIAWFDNIPIFSWLILRGHCRQCHGRISPRYLIVEAVTALLVGGLFLAYYVFHLRSGAGTLEDTWPMFLVHAMLLCGLLACSLVDIDYWQVPLEICWFVSALALVVWTIAPMPSWMPTVSTTAAAACVGAGLGLIASILLQRFGYLQPSFLDAADPTNDTGAETPAPNEPRTSIAVTARDGVSPRLEMGRELLFLAPAILGAILAAVLVSHIAPLGEAWRGLWTLHGGQVGLHLDGLFAGLFGFLIGGILVWGVRILGTLGFGKEAMGLGDVHIMAAVGAAGGWIVVVAAFFVAPFFGLLWAMILLIRRGQRELPYGPWLSAASVAVLIGYDTILTWVRAYCRLMNVDI